MKKFMMILLAGVFVYISMAFLSLEWNPWMWGFMARVISLMIVIGVVTLIMVIYPLDDF